MHKGTTRIEHRSNHQMRRTSSGPSATSLAPPPPPSMRCLRTPQGRGLRPALHMSTNLQTDLSLVFVGVVLW